MKWYNIFRMCFRVPVECFDGNVQGTPLISSRINQITLDATIKMLASGGLWSGAANAANTSGKFQVHAKPHGKGDPRAVVGTRDNEAITILGRPSSFAPMAAREGFGMSRSGALLRTGPVRICDPEHPFDIAKMLIVAFTWGRGSDADYSRDYSSQRRARRGQELWHDKQKGVRTFWVSVDQPMDSGSLPPDMLHSTPLQ